MTKIKICGITNLEDALLAVEAGADALGFIFANSPRRITPERAKEIIAPIPPFVCKVGVFKNEEMATVKEILNLCCLDLAQFHGEEDISYIRNFGPRSIKVFEMKGKEFLDEIKKFSLPCFILDLPKRDNETHLNWTLIQEAKKYGRIILAGGLTPENIEECLKKTAPYGIDVCRGVEKERGIKSPEKLKKFILKVKKWNIQKMKENSESMGDVMSPKL
ncbi:MAG: N-(5'-phosphoribosyl)anthranilate isomerase [Candidatus Aminicenantales bacterium]